jgi:hypothetical protein
MKLSKLSLLVTASLLSVFVGGANASQSIQEKLFVNKESVNEARSEQSTGIRKIDITMVSGEERERVLRDFLGANYPEGESVVVSYGTDINNEYYKSLFDNQKKLRTSQFGVRSADDDVNLPNDPFFLDAQYFNFDRIQDQFRQGSPQSVGAYNITIPFAPSTVGIIDGEYTSTNDINVIDGMGFYSLYDPVTGEFTGTRVHDDWDNGSRDVCNGYSIYHGLGVASISSALMNNNDGLSGYGNADVVYAKALTCGLGSGSDVSRAIFWMAGASVEEVGYRLSDDDKTNWRKRDAVDVINMSLGGGYECTPDSNAAIQFANNNNIPVVVAAGNESNDGVSAPAICEGSIGVVALDGDGDKAGYSNYGNGADIAVVGTGVATYDFPYYDDFNEGDDITGIVSNGYRYMSGTSMASPIVAAVVGQIKQVDPTITPEEILRLIQDTSDPFPETSNCYETYYCGAGILNAERALEVATGRAISDMAVAIPAINQRAICEVEVLTLNTKALVKMCSAYKLEMTGLRYLSRNIENVNYKIYQVEKGMSVKDTDTPIAETSVPFGHVNNIDASQFDYIAKSCSGDDCSVGYEALVDINPHTMYLCED